MVILIDGYICFFASNEKERDLWVRIFCRIIDVNQETMLPTYHLTYEELMFQEKAKIVSDHKEAELEDPIL